MLLPTARVSLSDRTVYTLSPSLSPSRRDDFCSEMATEMIFAGSSLEGVPPMFATPSGLRMSVCVRVSMLDGGGCRWYLSHTTALVRAFDLSLRVISRTVR